MRDVLHCLEHLNEGGLIVMHDCFPTSEPMQAVPRSQKEWTGDVWKALVELRFFTSGLEVFVLDCDHGLGIIRRKRPGYLAPKPFFRRDELSYAFLDKHRDQLLGLKHPEDWAV